MSAAGSDLGYVAQLGNVCTVTYICVGTGAWLCWEDAGWVRGNGCVFVPAIVLFIVYFSDNKATQNLWNKEICQPLPLLCLSFSSSFISFTLFLSSEKWYLTQLLVLIFNFFSPLSCFSQQDWQQLWLPEEICGMKPDHIRLSFTSSFISLYHAPVRNAHLGAAALMR